MTAPLERYIAEFRSKGRAWPTNLKVCVTPEQKAALWLRMVAGSDGLEVMPLDY